MRNLLHIFALVFILGLVYMPIGIGISDSAAINQSFLKFLRNNKNNSTPFLSSSLEISNNDINVKNDISLNYTKELVSVWAKISFSEENFKKLKKDKNGRPFSVDELAKQAEITGITDDISNSLKSWSELNNQVLSELKIMSVNKKQESVHKSMIGWYKYHISFSNKIADKSLSKDEIKKINNNYFKNAKYQLPSLHRKLAGLEGDSNDQFVLWRYVINSAKAIGGVPHFGGLITSYSEICLSGFSFVVFGVQGGWMWIYYPTMAIGGHMNYVIIPGGYILGKSFLGPGICTRILVDAHPSGTATVLYYGSSL